MGDFHNRRIALMTRIIFIMGMLLQLGGCVPIIHVESPDRLTFDVPPPEQVQLSYDDLLCCYNCEVHV